MLEDDKDAGMSIRVPDSMCVTPHGTANVKAKGHVEDVLAAAQAL